MLVQRTLSQKVKSPTVSYLGVCSVNAGLSLDDKTLTGIS